MLARLFGQKPSKDELQKVIQQLVASAGLAPSATFCLLKKDILRVCKAVKPALLAEPSLLELSLAGGLTVVGDIHGQFEDLIAILQTCGMPPKTRYLFLGDYVDRGAKGLEVVALLFALKLTYPEHVYLIRGNHEVSGINLLYGFYKECQTRCDTTVWDAVNSAFDCLPFAALVGNQIFAVHGGLSFHLYKLNQVRAIQRPVDMNAHHEGLLCDLLWSDPASAPKFQGWARNPRGQGFVFGTEAVDEFLSMNDIRMVLRAHQCIPRGIDFFGPGETFLTVFSAPHYANGDNTGAIVQFNDQGELSFEYFAESKAPHVDIERPSPTLSDALHQDAS